MSIARLIGAKETPKPTKQPTAEPPAKKPPCHGCLEAKETATRLQAVSEAPLVLDPGSAVPPPGRALTLPAGADEGQTACIVTCHDYGRFLRQCLDSLLAQDLPFDFILLVDDASSDDTEAIAMSYAPRIQYLRGEWRDFTKARRAGVAVLPRTRFLLFVDADNALPPNYHSALRALMTDPKVGAAYTPKRNMDEDGTLGTLWFAEWSYEALRLGNLADACSLIRTEAYDQAGGWRGCWGHGGLTDWMLWLRMTRLGWKLALSQDTELLYRRHRMGMQAQRGSDTPADKEAKINVHKDAFVTTIVTLFSGRQWMLDRYVAAVRNLRWNRKNLCLVAIDNSCDQTFGAQLKSALASLDITVICHRDTTRVLKDMAAAEFVDSAPDRGRNVYMMSTHLGRLYAKAREFIPAGTDLVWCWEDDIEPPPDALEHYVLQMFRFRAHAVSGCVRGRFADQNVLAWQGDWEKSGLDYLHPIAAPRLGENKVIQASGFMSTVFRREAFDRFSFRPAAFWNNQYPYYDWCAAYELHQAGWKWLLVGDVRCRHWQRAGTAMTV